jgi:hypothetical protein
MQELLSQVKHLEETEYLLKVNQLLLTGKWIIVNTYTLKNKTIFVLGRIKKESENTDLSKISTKELVNELIKREGVETTIAEPYKDEIVKANGPAIVLVITD